MINKTMWVDIMMHDELGMQKPRGESPIQSATLTFFSFVLAGSIPLLPYLFLGTDAPFAVTVASTAVALFIVGALRAYFSRQSWILLGLGMLVIGGFAAVVAYGVGAAIHGLV